MFGCVRVCVFAEGNCFPLHFVRSIKKEYNIHLYTQYLVNLITIASFDISNSNKFVYTMAWHVHFTRDDWLRGVERRSMSNSFYVLIIFNGFI